SSRRVGGGRRAGVGRSRAARKPNGIIGHQEIAQVPLEAQRMAVVLGHFNELGFDVHLGRRDVQHLHALFDQVQVGQRGLDQQRSFAVIEEHDLAGRVLPVDAQGDEELLDHPLNNSHVISAGNATDAAAAAGQTGAAAARAGAAAAAAAGAAGEGNAGQDNSRRLAALATAAATAATAAAATTTTAGGLNGG